MSASDSSASHIEDALSALHLVDRPRALRQLARFLALAFGVLILALIITPWQQTVIGSGGVVAYAPFDRIQTVAAPVGGRVRQAWVIEGSRVEAGDLLLEIVDNDPSILERLDVQRAALEMQLTSARERIDLFDKQIDALSSAREQSLSGAESQIEMAQASVRSERHALEGAKAKLAQSELNFRRQKELVDEGLVSGFEFEVAERVFRESQAKLAQAKQSLSAARSNLNARRAEQGRVGTTATAGVESARGSRASAEVTVASLSERLANLDTRIAQQNTQRVTAPRAGTVFRLFAAPGAQLVKAGDPLLTLVPDTEDRAVELWVRGNDVPLIEEGRMVRLQFEGWPAVQFSGWPSVAVGTFGGRVALVDSSDDGQGNFRVLITPDDEEDPWPSGDFLRQGVRAKGFVLLDQVTLAFELWRQANGFPPSVARKGDAAASGAKPKA
ncbi:MAG: HlyD family secretion protein [Myxococcota bacterium]